MIACIQRVQSASVHVNGELVSAVDKGLLAFIGVEKGDALAHSEKIAQKIVNLRVFSDDNGKMSLSVKDINGEILAVSQFTLAANTAKGNRPDFSNAASPEEAAALYEETVKKMETFIPVKKGIFGANMKVSLVNDGPVTILIQV